MLTDAINYFNKVNAQIKTTADNLGIPYTPSPSPPL
uniref:OMP606 n=1 Tax=Helicobacter bizzozeronii TaxID=56877 RepID=A0A1M4NHF1_HELBI|nr:OMP606 [Helicobacter bizzozeronii]